MARQDYQPTSQQQYPDLERMVQQRRLGYLDQQALLRSLNQQRMLQGMQPAHSIEEAVAAPPGKVKQTEVPGLQIDPRLFAGRGSSVESTSAPQDSGYGSALASLGDFGGLRKLFQQQGVPMPRPRPAEAGPSATSAPAAPAAAGPVRGGASSAQTGRPAFYQGTISLDGRTYTYGSGGGKTPSAPYGTFPITPEANGPIVQSLGGFTLNGNRLYDPLLGRDRVGIAIHPQTVDSLRSAGCFAVSREQWPAFKAALLDKMKREGALQITVHPDGRASIEPVGRQSSIPAPPAGAQPAVRSAAPQQRTAPAGPEIPPPAGTSQPAGAQSTGRLPTEAELSNKNVPVGERFNNPFNMWFDKYARAHGGADPQMQVTPQDRPASFPSKIDGAAAAIRKMAESPLYSGKTMTDLIGTWVGHGTSYAPIIEEATGISRHTVITPAFLKSEAGLNFLKTMARYETRWQQPYPLSDAEWRAARDQAFGAPRGGQPAAAPAAPAAPAAAAPPAAQSPQQPAATTAPVSRPAVTGPFTPAPPRPQVAPAPAPAQAAPPAAAAPAPAPAPAAQAPAAPQWRVVKAPNAAFTNLGGHIDANGTVDSMANGRLRSALVGNPSFSKLPPEIQRHIQTESINLNKIAPYRDHLGMTDQQMEQYGIRFERVPGPRSEAPALDAEGQRIAQLAASPAARAYASQQAPTRQAPLPQERSVDPEVAKVLAQEQPPTPPEASSRAPELTAGARPPFAVPPSYNTELPFLDEMAFRQWLKDKGVPFNPDVQPQDYDMRGFYRAQTQENPIARSAIDPNDQRMHYPDYWKTPRHETFSAESQWAKPGAPNWHGDQLITPGGRILFDDANPPRELFRPERGVQAPPSLSEGLAKAVVEATQPGPQAPESPPSMPAQSAFQPTQPPPPPQPVQTTWEPPVSQSASQPFGQGNLSPIPWDWMQPWGWGGGPAMGGFPSWSEGFAAGGGGGGFNLGEGFAGFNFGGE